MSPAVPAHRAVTVTPKQYACLGELLRDGATNHQIARRLGLSEDTVKTHLRGVAIALGVSGRTAIALAVVRGQVLVSVREPVR